MTREKYAIAFTEVLSIIGNMSESNKNRIPEKFINFLEENKDVNHSANNISLKDAEKFNRETRIIMALIYRDFFLTKLEKEEKEKIEQEELKKVYSYEKLFEHKTIEEHEEKIVDEIEVNLVEIKEKSKFELLLNSIKEKIENFFNIFKK